MIVVTGDDMAITCVLSVRSGSVVTPLDMSAATAVKANLVKKNHASKFMALDTDQNLSNPANDLTNGVIVIEFAKASTAAITEYGKALLEIAVVDASGKERTWFIEDIVIVQGQVD